MKKQNTIMSSLQTCKNESDVQRIFDTYIGFYFSNDISIQSLRAGKGHCDSFLKKDIVNGKCLRLLIEYKYKKDLNHRAELAGILIQVIFYISKLHNQGIQPNVVMVGVKEYCFISHVNPLAKYLELWEGLVDWNTAPSKAKDRYSDLIGDLCNDGEIPWLTGVKNIDDTFSIENLFKEIYLLCEDVKIHIRIKESSLSVAYEEFRRFVFKDTKIPTNLQVACFVGLLTKNDLYHQHNGYLFTPIENIKINQKGFLRFKNKYVLGDYTPEEKRKITSIMDRLIDDTDRRKQGAFFTPTKFVNYAHSMIENELGDDWKNEYVVFDSACGSLNLTRDFHFNELYCSTLDKGELDIGSRYNQNAKKWVMDFLNDGDDKFDEGLIKAFEQNKPIVFFINPPYGTAGSGITKKHKKDTNKTIIREEMNKEKFGGSENLQHQFMYRITKLVEKYNLTNAYFALFSKPIWLSGAKQGVFLKNFTSRWECKNAYLFQASHFADVSDAWGISLTLWKANHNATPITEYNMKLIDMLDDGSIDVIGHHTIYNSYFYNKASNWVKEPIKNKKDKIEYPCLTSGLTIKELENNYSLPNLLGSFLNDTNSVQKNAQLVALSSSILSAGHCLIVPIIKENFTRCSMLFTARKLIDGNWINDKDEYLAPDENHKNYKRFEADSIIYSLFHNSSNQTSLRQITYKGNLYDIPNEFFWMYKEEMKNLANAHHDDFMYDDASISKERYVFTLLQKPEIKKYLSKTAKQLLQIATELVIESMQYRTEFAADHPDHHIHCWDCGYYQLKNLWKQYLPDKFKKFRELYKQFGNELRPLVYELGFLRQ